MDLKERRRARTKWLLDLAKKDPETFMVMAKLDDIANECLKLAEAGSKEGQDYYAREAALKFVTEKGEELKKEYPGLMNGDPESGPGAKLALELLELVNNDFPDAIGQLNENSTKDQIDFVLDNSKRVPTEEELRNIVEWLRNLPQRNAGNQSTPEDNLLMQRYVMLLFFRIGYPSKYFELIIEWLAGISLRQFQNYKKEYAERIYELYIQDMSFPKICRTEGVTKEHLAEFLIDKIDKEKSCSTYEKKQLRKEFLGDTK